MIAHLEKLHNICSLINATPVDDYATVMDISAIIAKNFLDALSAFIFILDEGKNLVCISDTVKNFETPSPGAYPAPPLFYSIMKNESTVTAGPDMISAAPYLEAPSLLVPLIANGSPIGVAAISRPDDIFLTPESSVIINTVFSIVSSLIYNGMLFAEKEKAAGKLNMKNIELAQSLASQQTLLQELHHRVKNNLQIILSIINLQLQRTGDPVVIEPIRIIGNRIRSIALVHEKLLWEDEISAIDFRKYIDDIAAELKRAYCTHHASYTIRIQGDELSLSLDQAIPCGLIINEAITNSMKYAFTPQNTDPRIDIALQKNPDGTATITVQDNGPGIREQIDPESAQTLGFMLMHSLATSNLRGRLSLDAARGVSITVSFPLLAQKSR